MEQTDAATRLVLSYPADLSDWGRDKLETPSFRAYIRKTQGGAAEGDGADADPLEPGDVLEEFVGVGCCGDTLDVPLRVEAVEGGDRIGEDTEIEYEVREACGVQGNWTVQSAGGPSS